MQVILIERVEKLGVPGEIVEVKRGYARNWLLPQGKALIATKENKIIAENEKKQLIARDNAKKAEAETVKRALNDKRVFLMRTAAESGQLYGSVRDADIANEIEKQLKILVSKKFIILQQPIRTIGISDVKIALHPQVDIRIEVNVAPSQDEAKAQALKHDNAIAKQKAEQKNKDNKQSEAKQSETKKSEAKQSEAKQSEAKQSEAKQSEAKQTKSKQSKIETQEDALNSEQPEQSSENEI